MRLDFETSLPTNICQGFFVAMLLSCGFFYSTYPAYQCPEGTVQFPNSQYCQTYINAAGKYMVTNAPDGFFRDNINKMLLNIKGSRFIGIPLGESNEVVVAIMKDNSTIAQISNLDAIVYYINESTDSFVLDLRKLPDNLGFKDDGEGIFLNGTFNEGNPNPDWKWNVTSDAISSIPIRTYPAIIIH